MSMDSFTAAFKSVPAEYWAAILGSIVAFLGAMIIATIFFNLERRIAKAEKLEKDKDATTYAMHKLHRMFSDVFRLCEHIDNCYERRIAKTSEPWQFMIPMIGPTSSYKFSEHELKCISGLDDEKLMQFILDAPHIHEAHEVVWKKYCELKAEFTHMVPPNEFDGKTGAMTLSEEQYNKLRPFMIQMNDIIESLYIRIGQDTRNFADATQQLVMLRNKKYDLKSSLQLEEGVADKLEKFEKMTFDVGGGD